jgi:hypothetical protein
MRRFSLRTLIIVMLVGGPVCAWGWREGQSYVRQEEIRKLELAIQNYKIGPGDYPPEVVWPPN